MIKNTKYFVGECIGEACSEVECQHGGKCVASPTSNDSSNIIKTIYPVEATAYSSPILPTPICLCPLGYTGNFCEKQLNLEVIIFFK